MSRGRHTSAPFVLEDEILQVFQRLDFQSWSTGILHPTRTDPSAPDPNVSQRIRTDEVPSSFSDLTEARRWWDLVQHWVLRFPQSMVRQLQKLVEDVGAPPGHTLDFCDIPGVQSQQHANLAMLERWAASFWPLYAAARQSGGDGSSAFLQAVSLQLQYLTVWMQVRSICYSHCDTMYMMTPQFREVVRLSAIMLPHQPLVPGTTEMFTMENGPVMALFVTSTKCRDAEVRQEAISLLERYPRRDGFWDSKLMLMLARANQLVEADNATEGDMRDQWSRLRQREAMFDPRKPEAMFDPRKPEAMFDPRKPEAMLDPRKPEVKVYWFTKDKDTGKFTRKLEVMRWGIPTAHYMQGEPGALPWHCWEGRSLDQADEGPDQSDPGQGEDKGKQLVSFYPLDY